MSFSSLSFKSLCAVALLATMSCQNKNAQQKHASQSTPDKQWKFPDDWYGKYRGDLKIYNTKGLGMTVPMELEVLKSDTVGRVNWNIIYDPNGRRDFRAYAIIEKDAKKGEYVMDEFNTILISEFLIDNTLYSRFSVEKNDLSGSYRYVGDAIDFDITVSSTDSLQVTGGTDEETPPVIDYKINSHHRCHLVRYKK